MNISNIHSYIYKTFEKCTDVNELTKTMQDNKQIINKLYNKNKINIDEYTRLTNYINQCLFNNGYFEK